MSIKIRVTPEMIRNAMDLAPCPLMREEMWKMLDAAVRVVERDLNASASEFECGEWLHVNLESHGCIEVEG